MSRFVLVHGAWHGAWCWGDVAGRLREAGHEVVVPTLAGVGERADERTAEPGLADHVGDVVAALAAGTPSLLVGHSYAGLVVRQAADRVPGRVERVVLVDGWAGPDGVSLFGLAPPWFSGGLRGHARDGRLPAPAPALVGVVDEPLASWVQERLTSHPLRTFEDRTTLTGAVDALPGTAILCRPGVGLPFEEMARALAYEPVDIACGHDAMVLAPATLAQLLLGLAA